MPDNYLILDSHGQPVARCTADVRPQQEIWTLTVDPRDMEKVLDHEYIQLVGASAQVPPAEGKILKSRGNRLQIQKLRSIGAEVRQNLRMPVRFDSYLYPITGRWQGRREIISLDLSCGGIAFFCKGYLVTDELVEVVIPVTTEPLILRARILRQLPTGEDLPLYAATFVDLTPGEEAMVREAVFSLQIGSAD